MTRNEYLKWCRKPHPELSYEEMDYTVNKKEDYYLNKCCSYYKD